MRSKKAITVAEAIASSEARLVMDLPCETCGCEHWEKVDLEGRLYYRCAGTWSNGDDCRHLRPVPVLKDAPPVANVIGEPKPVATPTRVDDSADLDTALKAMLRDADARAALHGTEAERNRVMDDARALKAISDARRAGMPGERPPSMPLETYVEFFRRSRR